MQRMVLADAEGRGSVNSPRGPGRQLPGPGSGKLGLWIELPGPLRERLQPGKCCLPGFTPSLPGTRTGKEE